MELYLLALVGMILHVLFKFKAEIEKIGFDRALKQFRWIKQLVLSSIGLLSVFTLIYLKDSLAGLLKITQLTAVLIGYMGDSVFKNVILKEQKKSNLLKKSETK